MNESKLEVLLSIAVVVALVTLGLSLVFYSQLLVLFGVLLMTVQALCLTLILAGGVWLAWFSGDRVVALLMRFEELRQAKATTEQMRAQALVIHSQAALNHAQVIASSTIIKEVTQNKALFMIHQGETRYIPALTQPNEPETMLLPAPEQVTHFMTTWVDTLMKQAKSLHMILFGSRNSGKSTLVNCFMNEYFVSFDMTLVDPLFNQVDSGWLLPTQAKVSKNFVQAVTEFYESHQALVQLTETSRQGQGRKILIIDEAPSLLKSLKATDKATHAHVMAMLRSIYSTGSHTNHNLILLSQTVLCEDLDLSSNDKGNFIQICIGSLSGDYLALRRGKANKKRLYERLAACTEQYEFYATYEDYKGIIDINPLPDLERYGAKRLYNGQSEIAVPTVPRDGNHVPAAILETSPTVPTVDLGLYKGRDLEIARHIVDGKSKTWVRDNVKGRNEDICKDYERIKAELYPSWDLSALFKAKGEQQS